MFIIAVDATEQGQHHFESQSHRTECWMEGYVAVPSEREADIMSCVGYGDLIVENGEFVDFIPHSEWIPDHWLELEPTADELMNILLGVE